MRASGLLILVLAERGASLYPATARAAKREEHRRTLSGQVSSTEEGAMEGVLVSAKKEGSTISSHGRERSPGTLPLSRRAG